MDGPGYVDRLMARRMMMARDRGLAGTQQGLRSPWTWHHPALCLSEMLRSLACMFRFVGEASDGHTLVFRDEMAEKGCGAREQEVMSDVSWAFAERRTRQRCLLTPCRVSYGHTRHTLSPFACIQPHDTMGANIFVLHDARSVDDEHTLGVLLRPSAVTCCCRHHSDDGRASRSPAERCTAPAAA